MDKCGFWKLLQEKLLKLMKLSNWESWINVYLLYHYWNREPVLPCLNLALMSSCLISGLTPNDGGPSNMEAQQRIDVCKTFPKFLFTTTSIQWPAHWFNGPNPRGGGLEPRLLSPASSQLLGKDWPTVIRLGLVLSIHADFTEEAARDWTIPLAALCDCCHLKAREAVSPLEWGFLSQGSMHFPTYLETESCHLTATAGSWVWFP